MIKNDEAPLVSGEAYATLATRGAIRNHLAHITVYPFSKSDKMDSTLAAECHLLAICF